MELVLKEVKEQSNIQNKTSLQSYKAFQKLFPQASAKLYEQFYQLILNDNELE